MNSITTIIAMVAACLIIYRLFTILGKKTGNEEQRGHEIRHARSLEAEAKNTKEQAAHQPSSDLNDVASAEIFSQAEKRAEQLTNNEALASIFDADSDFDLDHFIEGARAAYEIILVAFAEGDLKTLKPLLTQDTYKAFKASIDERKKLKTIAETEIIGINSVDITETFVKGANAYIKTTICADLVTFTRDADDQVIEGDPNIIEQVTDIWTFSKKLDTDSPEWFLSATDSEIDGA